MVISGGRCARRGSFFHPYNQRADKVKSRLAAQMTRSVSSAVNLDDATLDEQVAEQEGLVASDPSMAKYVQPSLQLHLAERERRNVALGTALLAVDQSAVESAGAAETAQAAEGMQMVIAQPAAEAAVEAAPAAAGRRLRKCPVDRFGEEVATTTAQPKDVAEMREVFNGMRTTIRETAKMIKANAERLRCPLSGQQMRRVALAGDGHLYDLRAIQAHIRANLGRQMVSPITKRPMTMEVHHILKAKKILWTPELRESSPSPAVCENRLSLVPPSPSA